MRFLYLILVMAPLFVGAQINQTDANGLRQGLWKKQQPNGRLLYEGHFKDGKPVGEWKRYHPGGQIKAIINYQSDSDTANVQLFDENGRKAAEGTFLNKKKTGFWRYYSGTRIISDEQYLNGEKNGTAHTYYNSGEILEATDWKNGKKEGNYRIYYKNGKPFMKYKNQDNKRNGLFLTYYPNGKTELEAAYKNGLRNGNWIYFKENGDKWYTLIYNNGELLNPTVRDSIAGILFQQMENNRDKYNDPEKYLNDPAQFLLKNSSNQ
ncbi:MAG: hypothetical protein CSA36_07625 [Draconibacterium sp.]|nr:MAG: hypothetical protein CSA36_07625 [Draconibacterium sp.]